MSTNQSGVPNPHNGLQEDEDSAPLLTDHPDYPEITIQHISAKDLSEDHHRTSKSWFSDDESQIRKLVGKEEIINSRTHYPDQIELVFNIGIIYNILFLLTLIYQSTICGLIINFYVVGSDNLRQLFVFLMIANLVRAIIDAAIVLFYGMLVLEYQRFIQMDLVSSIGYVIIYIGVVLYLSSEIQGNFLWIFALPQLLLDFFYYCIFGQPISLTENIIGKTKFLESVQNLMILFNIGFAFSTNWSFVMSFYFFEVFLLVVFSGIAAIIVVVGIIAWIIKFRKVFHDRIIPCYFLSFGVYAAGIGFFTFFMFIAVIRLFNRQNLLYPNPNKENMDMRLYDVAISMLVFCVGIFFCNLIFGLLSVNRIKNYVSYSTKETKYYEYNSQLGLAAKLISEHFFKKKSRLKGSEAKHDLLLNKCFICFRNEANVIIFPCGHTGFCKDCMLEDQIKRNACMICRKAVSKAKILVYDAELQEYVAKGEIRFFETISNEGGFLRD